MVILRNPIARHMEGGEALLSIASTPVADLYDSIIPRGLDCDTFIRPYSWVEGKILVDKVPSVPAEVLQGLPLRQLDRLDTEVHRSIGEELFSTPELKDSLVFVQVQRQNLGTGEVEVTTGSGCQISSHHIFTVDHLLEKNHQFRVLRIQVIKSGGIIVPGDLVPIDNLLWEYSSNTRLKISDVGLRWNANGKRLDFAVIRAHRTLAGLGESYLRVPENRLWYQHSTVCSVGFPGKVPVALQPSCFSEEFRELFASWPEESKNQLLRNLYDASLGYEGTPIASFGSVTTRHAPDMGCYMASTMSQTFGMSGGPVMNSADPTELIGLVIGNFCNEETTVFLDMQTPVVKIIYEMCLRESIQLLSQ